MSSFLQYAIALCNSTFWDYCSLILRTFGWKTEECGASDLVAGGFPADVGEGGVSLTIPFVASVEYPYLGRQVHPNATCLSLNHVINHLNEHAGM